MKAILLIDFGSTYTKVTLVDVKSEKILGTARSFTTVDTDINEGLELAINQLQNKLGHIDIEETYASSSAAGGLKMIAIGLVPELTTEAAKRAALSAGAKVIKIYSYELNEDELREIEELKPDIILLTGGTDGGNKSIALHNGKMLAKTKGDFPIIVAANKCVVNDIDKILKSADRESVICENVMPSLNILNIEPARKVIREVFLKRIIHAKGLTQVKNLLDGLLMPTPSAVLNAAKLLSTGYKRESGVGDLMVIDVGGATTDVHTLCDGNPTKQGVFLKGLEEPYAKRTVEGDLGVRYSASSLVDAVGIEEINEKSGLEEKLVLRYINKISENPEILPDNDEYLKKLDYGLTSIAVREGVKRHSGTIETHYTPFGVVYKQTGKDLSEVKKVIGTGGPIINSVNPLGVLEHALYDENDPYVLKPRNIETYLDKKYIFAAMGILAEKYPEVAIRIMKKEIINK